MLAEIVIHPTSPARFVRNRLSSRINEFSPRWELVPVLQKRLIVDVSGLPKLYEEMLREKDHYRIHVIVLMLHLRFR